MLRKLIWLWYGLCVSLGINGTFATDTQCPNLLHEPEDRREDNTFSATIQRRMVIFRLLQ